MDKIKEQTEALSAQIKKLESVPGGDDERYIKELEKYQAMIKNADFSPEAQAAGITSDCLRFDDRDLNLVDKVLAPPINWITRQVNNLNNELIEHNRRGNK